MRIDRLRVQNFKKFAEQTFALHPQFTLLAGENGSGKTSVLDALAVAAGIWLVKPPDTTLLHNSRRNILEKEIRLQGIPAGDRVQFLQQRPVAVTATGEIGKQDHLTWTRQITTKGKITNNSEAQRALSVIADIYARVAKGQHMLCPVLAYYGAGRAWLPSSKRKKEKSNGGPARRWAAFYDCFNERIRFDELRKWFHRETTAAGNRGGRMRPGFEVVKRAVLRCVPKADALWFDPDQEQVVLSIEGQAQPLDNLSAGQRVMLALVADIAIKAVTQNAFLLPAEELGPEDEPLPRLLQKTPGMVLIDELDVHLHPSWQRRVAADLKETFPKIQFVATTHSPQVVGELPTEQISVLEGGFVYSPEHSFGVDSSRILENIMATKPRTESIHNLLTQLARQIGDDDFNGARVTIQEAEAKLGRDDPEVIRALTLMDFMEQKS